MHHLLSYWLEAIFDVIAIPAFFLAAGISIDSVVHSSHIILTIFILVLIILASWFIGWQLDALTLNKIRFYELLVPLIAIFLFNFVLFKKNNARVKGQGQS
jgi:uncharacterized membrane protein AbrB (regulator of aidB expression)